MAAIAIDGRRLEIFEDGKFNAYIKPIFDEEECKKFGLDPLQDEALKVNNIKVDILERAHPIKMVWQQFSEYVSRYKKGANIFGLPIKAGYNIERFDNIIINRIMGGHNRILRSVDKTIPEPYGFGPWDDARDEERLFNPRDCIDLMKVYIWPWTENMSNIKSISMKSVREWLGMSDEKAHLADQDVEDGSKILIKFMQLTRNIAPKVKFEGAFAK